MRRHQPPWINRTPGGKGKHRRKGGALGHYCRQTPRPHGIKGLRCPYKVLVAGPIPPSYVSEYVDTKSDLQNVCTNFPYLTHLIPDLGIV
jgi:hypothetical protein